MDIEPILIKLLDMLEAAGIPITDRYLSGVTETQSPSAVLVYEVFKRFTYLNFDCSSFRDEEIECSSLLNDGVTFENGNYIFPSGEDLFFFGFRRTFRIITPYFNEDSVSIPTPPGDEPLEFTQTIACDLLFERSGSVSTLDAKRLSYKFAQQDQDNDLDAFFTQISLLDSYRIPMEQYRPRTLALYLEP